MGVEGCHSGLWECREEAGRREEDVVVKMREGLLWGGRDPPVSLQKELLMWYCLVTI